MRQPRVLPNSFASKLDETDGLNYSWIQGIDAFCKFVAARLRLCLRTRTLRRLKPGCNRAGDWLTSSTSWSQTKRFHRSAPTTEGVGKGVKNFLLPIDGRDHDPSVASQMPESYRRDTGVLAETMTGP